MKKYFLTAIILFWSGVAQATPGVVVETKGNVTVTLSGAKPSPAKIGVEFSDGAVFKAGKDGAAKLMMMDGSFTNVAAGSLYKAGAKAIVAQNNPGMVVAMREAVTQSGSGPTVHGMVKMVPGVPMVGGLKPLPPAGGVVATYPVNTTIATSGEIFFQWGGNPIVGDKPILVFFESGQPQKNFPLNKDQTEWKADAKKLGIQSGKEYNWYLGHLENGKPIAQSQKFVFKILSESQAKQLNSEFGQLKSFGLETPEGEQFLKAQIFYQYKMYDQMEALLSALYAQNQTPAIKRLLFLANLKLGRLEEAKKYQVK